MYVEVSSCKNVSHKTSRKSSHTINKISWDIKVCQV